MCDTTDRVLITGHSLGGALAVALVPSLINHEPKFYDDFEKYFREKTAVYTMGAYRPGDENFAKFFNKLIPNCWRVVNKNDPVPYLPPSEFLFKHPCNYVKYSDDTRFKLH